MGKTLLAAGEAPQVRLPERELRPGSLGRPDQRRAGLHPGGADQAPRPRVSVEERREVAGVLGPDGELVRIDHGQRGCVEFLQRIAHAVDGEVMQATPGHCPGCRVHDHTLAPIEAEAAADAGGPAVVEEHGGIGVEEPQVVDEVEHATGGLVHEAGDDVAAHPGSVADHPAPAAF